MSSLSDAEVDTNEDLSDRDPVLPVPLLVESPALINPADFIDVDVDVDVDVVGIGMVVAVTVIPGLVHPVTSSLLLPSSFHSTISTMISFSSETTPFTVSSSSW